MDVKDILTKVGYTTLVDCGKEWRTTPLYRDSDNKTVLAINKRTGDWYDFRDRIGGNIYQLVQRTVNLNSLDTVKSFLNGELTVPDVKSDYELSSIKKFDKCLLTRLQRDHKYWLGRGISPTTIEQFEGGITFNGRMAYRYVFPIFDQRDDVIGFSGRLLKDHEVYAKWKHLGAKSNWCYPFKWNKDVLFQTKEVILLESIGDMLSLWDAGIKNTLVTFGLSVSPKVIELLLKMDVNRIYIGFNNDDQNELAGNKAAEAVSNQLLVYFNKSQIQLALPSKKDFGEMTKPEISEWKKNLQKN